MTKDDKLNSVRWEAGMFGALHFTVFSARREAEKSLTLWGSGSTPTSSNKATSEHATLW
jgi:hypothetical protein